jgi:hypothetical protein
MSNLKRIISANLAILTALVAVACGAGSTTATPKLENTPLPAASHPLSQTVRRLLIMQINSYGGSYYDCLPQTSVTQDWISVHPPPAPARVPCEKRTGQAASRWAAQG